MLEFVIDGFDEVVAPQVKSHMNPSPIGYGTHTGRAAIVGAKLRAAALFAEDATWKGFSRWNTDTGANIGEQA
jgi:hypothetical protein